MKGKLAGNEPASLFTPLLGRLLVFLVFLLDRLLGLGGLLWLLINRLLVLWLGLVPGLHHLLHCLVGLLDLAQPDEYGKGHYRDYQQECVVKGHKEYDDHDQLLHAFLEIGKGVVITEGVIAAPAICWV